MPILVQWKWMEQTKSFLVIFHFFDDFSQPNLRMRKHMAENIRVKALLTWAPSHVELGLLSDILRYANIIDGLEEDVKRELREKLEMIREGNMDFPFGLCCDALVEVLQTQPKGKGLVSITVRENRKSPTKHLETAVYLCPEYINYIRKILKPYLKT